MRSHLRLQFGNEMMKKFLVLLEEKSGKSQILAAYFTKKMKFNREKLFFGDLLKIKCRKLEIKDPFLRHTFL